MSSGRDLATRAAARARFSQTAGWRWAPEQWRSISLAGTRTHSPAARYANLASLDPRPHCRRADGELRGGLVHGSDLCLHSVSRGDRCMNPAPAAPFLYRERVKTFDARPDRGRHVTDRLHEHIPASDERRTRQGRGRWPPSIIRTRNLPSPPHEKSSRSRIPLATWSRTRFEADELIGRSLTRSMRYDRS